MRAGWILSLFGVFFSLACYGHEVRPALLNIRQTGVHQFEVLWKVPGKGAELRLALDVVFPDGTKILAKRSSTFVHDAFIERFLISHPTGWTGGESIGVPGLKGTMTEALLRLERLSGQVQVSRLTPSKPSVALETVPQASAVARNYIFLGIEHIALGIDHLLFVLALVLLVQGRVMLFKTVTAFTVAHSITLVLTALGVVSLPSQPVEATIALSLLIVARELAAPRTSQQHSTWAKQQPWIMAFVFGLLHGFGFASALKEIGLPFGEIPLALLSFNVGVELGQVAFVAVLLLVMSAAKALEFPELARSRFSNACVYLIGCASTFWLIERVAEF